MFFQQRRGRTDVRRHRRQRQLRFETLETRRVLAAGALDTTFSGDGLVNTDFGSASDEGRAVALQADGKIVVAGIDTRSGPTSDFGIVRYHGDGSLDTGFGTSGLVSVDFAGKDDHAFDLAIQADGKIVVVGSVQLAANNNQRVGLARLNADGTLDASFGASGTAVVQIQSIEDVPTAVGIQADGKIVVAGRTLTSLSPVDFDFFAARFDTSGTLDTAFDGDGIAITDLGGTSDEAEDLVIQADGKIVVAGTGGSSDFGIVRYDTGGGLDATFGAGGVVLTDFNTHGDRAHAVALQTDGRIVAAGSAGVVGGIDFALARYLGNGSLDNTFGGDGRVTTSFSSFDTATGVAIQTNGKIVAAGSVDGLDFALARYLPDGSLDSSFDGDGRVTTDFAPGGEDQALGVVLQTDGKIVAAGFAEFGSDTDFAVARYEGDEVALTGSVIGMVWEDFNNDGEVNFGEPGIEGVLITLTGTDASGNAVNISTLTDPDGVYTLIDVPASDLTGYTLTETQPSGFLDGMDVLGTVDGVPIGSVSANDTCSGIVLPAGATAEDYNFGERPESGGEVAPGQTATIGFWKNKNGAALIESLNGGPTSTQLGQWLASTFPNMYGANGGVNDLTGQTNVQVADKYKELFKRNKKSAAGGGPPKMDAQVMATALAVYVTSETLAGTTAASYGFTVTATGLGTSTFNVGSNGAAVNAADHADVQVLDLLLAVDAQAHNGLLYDLDEDGDADDSQESLLRTMANDLFSAINEAGDI